MNESKTSEDRFEPCKACGKPVKMNPVGQPQHEALCDLQCIKEWCRMTGSEFLTMEEYAERKNRKQAPSEN